MNNQQRAMATDQARRAHYCLVRTSEAALRKDVSEDASETQQCHNSLALVRREGKHHRGKVSAGMWVARWSMLICT